MNDYIKNITKRILDPGLIAGLILSLLSLVIIGISIWVAFDIDVQQSIGFFAYIIFGLAAIFLAYLIYLISYFVKNYKKDNHENFVFKSKFLNKLFKDYVYRTKALVIGAGALALIMAIYNIAIACINKSTWSGVMGAYFVIMLVLYAFVIFRIYGHVEKGDRADLITYIATGAGLIAINIPLIWAEIEIMLGRAVIDYGQILIYIVALYAFIKTGIAIGNIKISAGMSDYVIKSIRALYFIDALVSMMTLQLAMYVSFAQGLEVSYTSHGSLCTVISIISIVYGTYIIIKGAKNLKNIDLNKNTDYTNIAE